MKNSNLLFFLLLVILVISSCGSINDFRRTVKDLPTGLKDESRGITREMVIGIFEGLNTEQTSNNIDDASRELVSKVIETINFELARVDFGQLKVEVIGNDLVLSVVETLEDNQDALGAAITGSLDQIDFTGLFENLSSDEQQKALSNLFGSMFSAESGNGEKLGQMLNRAIQEIDLAPLGKQIEENIDLNASLAESFDKLLEVTYEIGEVRSLVASSQRSLPLTISYWVIGFLAASLGFFLIKKLLTHKTSRNILTAIDGLEDHKKESLIRQINELKEKRVSI